MRKKILLIVAVVIGISVSVAAYYRSNAGEDLPRYTTASVTRGSVVEKIDATGTLAAVTTVQVGTQISGTIKALHADYNSRVKKGQVIAELEPSLLQTQVEQAQASLQKLTADVDRARVEVEDSATKHKRAQELWDKQLIPRTDLETADATARQAEAALKSTQAQVAQARAALNQNQVNLNHAVITAPIDGVVISRSVDVGQTVAASMQAPTLFVLAQDLREMQVNASIDEADIGRVAVGQPVTFKVDAYPNETFTGTVAQVRLEPKVESNVVSYTTIINVPNPDLKLKPGMTATVSIEVARADDVLVVPSAALRFRPASAAGTTGTSARTAAAGAPRSPAAGAPGSRPRTALPAGDGAERSGRVFVVEEGQLQPVRVKTGVSDGTNTAVIEGQLAENAPVVTGMAASTQTSSQPAAGSPLLPFGGRGRQGRPAGAGR